MKQYRLKQREKMMFTFKIFQAQNAKHQIIRHTQRRLVLSSPAILFTCDNNGSATRIISSVKDLPIWLCTEVFLECHLYVQIFRLHYLWPSVLLITYLGSCALTCFWHKLWYLSTFRNPWFSILWQTKSILLQT